MAKICEYFNEVAWAEWVDSRPEVVRDIARRLPPDRLYRLKPSGQRVTMESYSEDGTVRVSVSGKYNITTFERSVFGINPDDLEECDLPASDEPLGALLTEPEEVDAFIDLVREDVMKASRPSAVPPPPETKTT